MDTEFVVKKNLRGILVGVFIAASSVGSAATGPVIVPEDDEGTPETYEIVWPTEGSLRYELQSSIDLGEWAVSTGFPVDGSGDAFHYKFSPAEFPTFFRVLTLDPLPEQLLNLPVPADGNRMDSLAEFDGPRWPETYGDGFVTLWHEDKFAAYSITIDDNNSPDFPFWREVSEDYGWKLTWFVIVHPYVWDIYNDVPGSNTGYFGTLDEFRELHEAGHDIQLHGACSAMNDLTAEAYEDHIVRSINVLENGVGTQVRSFAYPCGKIVSEDGDHDYYGIIERYLIGARGTSGGVTPVHRIDYLNTKSLGVNRLVDGGPGRLLEKYNDGSRSLPYSSFRGWCVSLYHGVGDGEGRAGALETFDWVKAHEDEFWVAPFTDVAKYAQQRESHTLEISEVATDRIVFNLSDRMDDVVFDHPLTVKLRLAVDWAGITAEQSGETVAARLVEHDGATFALVEPVPDRGLVVVSRAEAVSP